MKLLGIDYGTKRVGIALSDDLGRVAFPHGVFQTDDALVSKIKKVCEEEDVETIVIGESHNFKQEENPIMPAVRELKAELERETGLLVHLEPEMLTSRQARRAPSAKQEKTRKPFKKENVDASAAALILQGFIDRNKNI